MDISGNKLIWAGYIINNSSLNFFVLIFGLLNLFAACSFREPFANSGWVIFHQNRLRQTIFAL